MIGIMDTQIIEANKKNIHDISSSSNNGYGLSTYAWYYGHANDHTCDGNIWSYMNQFDISDKTVTMTMELDMTQKESDGGILKYICHNKPKNHVTEIKTHGQYSNIIYKDVDIDKKYCAAFSMRREMNWIEFVGDYE